MANLAKERMPLPGTLGAPRFDGADVTRFLEIYESIACHMGTNPDQDDVVDIFPYYYAADLQEMVKMMSGYTRRIQSYPDALITLAHASNPNPG